MQNKIIEKEKPQFPVHLRSAAVKDKIRQWVLAGKSNSFITKQLEEDTLGIGHKYDPDNTRSLIADAKKALRKEASEIKEHLIEELTSKLTDLYSKNYDRGDYRECREVINSINKILGLNNGNKVEIARENEVINIQFN